MIAAIVYGFFLGTSTGTALFGRSCSESSLFKDIESDLMSSHQEPPPSIPVCMVQTNQGH